MAFVPSETTSAAIVEKRMALPLLSGMTKLSIDKDEAEVYEKLAVPLVDKMASLPMASEIRETFEPVPTPRQTHWQRHASHSVLS